MAHYPETRAFTGILNTLRFEGDILDCEVEGEIRYGRMAVEAGAKIEGLCMLDDGQAETVSETQMMSVDHEQGPLQQTA